MSSIEIANRYLRTIDTKLQQMDRNVYEAINNHGTININLSTVNDKMETVSNLLTQEVELIKEKIAHTIERIEVLESVHSTVPEYVGEPLYVILPYFNYCLFQKRTTLFIDFIERYANTRGIKIVIVEGVLIGEEPQLPDFSSKVFLHIQIPLKDRIWIKENLINLAVKRLPEDWKYMSWIDADITFLNTNWVFDTMNLLETNQFVQMFHSAVNMGPDGESLKVEQSFIYMHKHSGVEFNRTSRYGVWHPGFAWACTREAYDKIGGLLEIGILGSGDRHTALALIGKADMSYPGNIGLSYQAKVLELQEKCIGFNIDYVKGTVLHHFHGSIADRKYVDRWAILTNNLYNVKNDVYHNEQGVLSLTEKGLRLQPEIDAYFLGRNEDSTKA